MNSQTKQEERKEEKQIENQKKGGVIGVGFSISRAEEIRYVNNLENRMRSMQESAAKQLGNLIFTDIGSCVEVENGSPELTQYEARYIVIKDDVFKDFLTKLDDIGLHEVNLMIRELIK